MKCPIVHLAKVGLILDEMAEFADLEADDKMYVEPTHFDEAFMVGYSSSDDFSTEENGLGDENIHHYQWIYN